MGTLRIGTGPGARWLVVLALAWLVAGCGTESTEEGSRPIRMGLARAPLTFDPRFASDSTGTRINRLIYRSLTDFGADGAPKPDLATWEALSPTHYRFRLVADIPPFHNGAALTARDVAATYQSILAPGVASPHKSSISHIDRMEILDPRTLDIHLSRPDYQLPANMDIGILPADLIEKKHPFSYEPVGNGPLKALDGGNDFLWRFQRVSDGQVIEFHQVAEPTVRALKLIRGEIEMLQNDLLPEVVNYLREQPGITVETTPGMTFAYLGFNLEHKYTGNLKVREAVAQGIDRESIVRYLFNGNARPALSMLRPGHWAVAKDLPPITFDPDKSRALLAELGYGPDNPLHLVYKTSADPFRLRLATVLQSQLKDIGIDLKIQSHDWGTFYGDIKGGRFEMYSLAWTSLHSPEILRNVCHSESLPPKGANRGRYKSAEMDRALDRADLAPTAAERLEALHEAQRLMRRDLVYVPLWYEGHTAVLNSQLRGYGLYIDGRYDDLAKVTWAGGGGAK